MCPYNLAAHGIENYNHAYFNLSTPALYEEIVRRREGLIAFRGPVVVRTGELTGRSPDDKFIVKEPTSEELIWWGTVNRPFDPAKFDQLYNRMLAYLQGKDIYVQDLFVCADPRYQVPIRVITETAWHNLFARSMFIKPKKEQLEEHVPEFTLINAPGFRAVPSIDGTKSETFILIHFGKKRVVIGGTSYGGEIKKAMFTVLNYLLPQGDIMTMHCSATLGEEGDTAVLFGLSGTGKTTLSADPKRRLIGDDEHGWSPYGIFNFEGGCYAKVWRLSEKSEPQIYTRTRRFGTILENVRMDIANRQVDLDDESLTQNTRACYSLSLLPNSVIPSVGTHPRNIIMLTCDAFGIMPPIAKLTREQALYHFLSGYTAKVAGTERGLGSEPEATFSACFGAPFMVLHPYHYVKILNNKIKDHNVDCWLVNTGWTGGPFGTGHRMPIEVTRALVDAALSGRLKEVEFEPDPVFKFLVPKKVEGVPTEMLKPRNTWKDGNQYDAKARELANRFHKNFEKYASEVSEEVKSGGPS